ncbi:MAG: hypothetical protein KAQ71_19120, partial [Desulfobulbaceae bacterium]|nr:hypothetical protein [Desulfobulbaceae bacterium]
NQTIDPYLFKCRLGGDKYLPHLTVTRKPPDLLGRLAINSYWKIRGHNLVTETLFIFLNGRGIRQ